MLEKDFKETIVNIKSEIINTKTQIERRRIVLWICTKKEKSELKTKKIIVKKVFQKSTFRGINRLMENFL